MNQITCSYSTESSSSSSYDQEHAQNTNKSTKSSSYHTSLHSVRNPTRLRKPPTTKHFIAPLPPNPIKIYEVEPSKFKDLVRVLTSAPRFQHPSARRFRDKAPPPLRLPATSRASPPPQVFDDGGIMSPISSFLMSPDFYNLLSETMQTTKATPFAPGTVDYFDGLNPLGLWSMPGSHDQSGGALVGLSPTSLSWCSSVLFGPK